MLTGVELAALLFMVDTTQTEFARFVGVTPRSVRRWTSANVDVPLWVARVAISLQSTPEECYSDFELAPWQTLGLASPNSTVKEIKAARIRLSKMYFHDHAKDEKDRIFRLAAMQRINDAYDELVRASASKNKSPSARRASEGDSHASI
jgi:hypothetical protein